MHVAIKSSIYSCIAISFILITDINCNNNNISSIKTRTAKNVVTSVIVKAIYSKPGTV